MISKHISKLSTTHQAEKAEQKMDTNRLCIHINLHYGWLTHISYTSPPPPTPLFCFPHSSSFIFSSAHEPFRNFILHTSSANSPHLPKHNCVHHHIWPCQSQYCFSVRSLPWSSIHFEKCALYTKPSCSHVMGKLNMDKSNIMTSLTLWTIFMPCHSLKNLTRSYKIYISQEMHII